MAYNNFNNAPNMALPSYASRGKASGLKRLSVAAQPSVASISEHEADGTQTPQRTSRSHLLAGLRTQPKTPSVPNSAPYYQSSYAQTKNGLNTPSAYSHMTLPHTAVGTNFPPQQYAVNASQQYYALPEQVLAPPPMEIDEHEQFDPNYLAQLAAAEASLNLRAQMLQQQLASLQLASRQQMLPQNPVAAQMAMYQQQFNMSQLPQEIQPGVYAVFNPLTGQYQYMIDPNAAATQATMQAQMAAAAAPQLANSPPPPTPRYDSPVGRSISPPKKTHTPTQDLARGPLTGDFRRGHTKNVASLKLSNAPIADGPKSAMVRPVGMPATPMTGTFGPGQGRAGEHPTRQPRGPPALDELKAKPTTLHEGSKNFATRQRRKALSSLVRAGLERRVRPGSGSQGSMTPVSETDMTFSVPSDNDSDSGRSLSGRLSIGSLRAVASGAIGSERKASKEELKVKEVEVPIVRRRTPLLALANAAEKRRSIIV